jgi:hypothetical protein
MSYTGLPKDTNSKTDNILILIGIDAFIVYLNFPESMPMELTLDQKLFFIQANGNCTSLSRIRLLGLMYVPKRSLA